ncbi:MAG: hypothetical protein M1838_000049 [Thelocarpon superellum]|nr:MAG: hypothetical protein M1838_000049 [Thelocarpon superellum]
MSIASRFLMLWVFFLLPTLLHRGVTKAARSDFVAREVTANSSIVLQAVLYVSSYAGYIDTIALFQDHRGKFNLKLIATNHASVSPSCLLWDAQHGNLYDIDEYSTPGKVISLRVQQNRTLRQLHQFSNVNGGVSGAFYTDAQGRQSNRALAIADYEGSALSTFTLEQGGGGMLFPSQNFTFSYAQDDEDAGEDLLSSQNDTFALHRPAPATSLASAISPTNKQDAPHPHNVVVDPKGLYLLVPDLGSDLLRMFGIAADSIKLEELPPFAVDYGSGPRHALFFTSNGSTWLYLVSEIACTITAYYVEYPVNNHYPLLFIEVYKSSTVGPGRVAPNGTAAAEIAIQGDKVYISNRGDGSFGPTNDSISIFSINGTDGTLHFDGLHPAFGYAPRYFNFNKHGDLMALGVFQKHESGCKLHQEAILVLVERDVETGKLCSAPVASLALGVPDQVTWIVWDE